jgi:hypothetical protein
MLRIPGFLLIWHLCFFCFEARCSPSSYFREFLSSPPAVIELIFSVKDLSETDLLTDPQLLKLGTVVKETVGAENYYAVKMQEGELLLENSYDFDSLLKLETTGLSLELVFSESTSDIPRERTNTVLIARDNSGKLHFRLFDDAGKITFDENEHYSLINAAKLDAVKKQVDSGHQHERLADLVTSLAEQHTFKGSGHVYGLVTNVFWSFDRRRRVLEIDHDKGAIYEDTSALLRSENEVFAHSFFLRTALNFGLPPGQERPQWNSATDFAYRASRQHMVVGTVVLGASGKPERCSFDVWFQQNGTSNLRQRARISYSYSSNALYPSQFTINSEAFGTTNILQFENVYRILHLRTPNAPFDLSAFSPYPYIEANSETIRVRVIRNARVIQQFGQGVWQDERDTRLSLFLMAFIAAVVMLPIIILWRAGSRKT